ncbi:MAG: M20/M25/M40 family metallo-hydrolase [Spirochaetales bacterium]|nr:M20/M25/M40 family metallo-hydrolase [Spirochaetales bacterium]
MSVVTPEELERPVFRYRLLPLFRDLIRCGCVNTGEPDSGQEDRAVAVLREFFASYGLETRILHGRPGRGNLLVKVPGSDATAPSLTYMNHVDVVPANAADWSCDPFAADLKDGQVWGRGAVDMLCWTACQAVGLAEALKARPQRNFPGNLSFLALADEEAAGRWGARFLVEQFWEDVKCDAMVTELGGFFADTDRGPAAFINRGEKGVAWVKLTARGRAGHGSMPYGADNALLKAAEAALRLGTYRAPLLRHPSWRSMAKTAARGFGERVALLSGWGEGWVMKRIFRRDPGMAKFLDTAGHTTFSPNVVAGGDKINVICDRSELLVDVRFLPGQDGNIPDEAGVEALVRQALGPQLSSQFHFELLDFHQPTLSSLEGPLDEAIRGVFSESHPDASLVDLMIGGVTDGRYWRDRGTTVYGFTLFDREMTMGEFTSRMHGVDERISLNSLALGLRFFTQLPGKFWKV